MPLPSTPHLEHEQQLWQQNCLVFGVDEVGRGCLAGPVVVAAVRFDSSHLPIEGVKDSKKLSLKKRVSLAEQIKAQASYWKTGQASVAEINRFGIVPATMMAISRALPHSKNQAVLMDGNPFLDSHQEILKKLNLSWPAKISYIVKGDSISYSIAAASIIAKVYRDDLMVELAEQFPDFGWQKNVGYGTKQHRQAIQKLGANEHHREIFVRNLC
jgi:ribonuclease HII